VSGAADDYSMSDEPIGFIVSDYSMSDEPVGSSEYDDEVGTIKQVDPDSMDYDIFSGDMMES